MRYNDPKHIEQFKKAGEFPAIHDDIIYLIKETKPEEGGVLDLGSSIGMLAKQLTDHFPFVIGIEGNRNEHKTAQELETDKLIFKNYYLNSIEDLEKTGQLIIDHGIKTVVARRVFPEIYDKGGAELIQHIGYMFQKAGIERIYLEGRKKDSRSKHPLKSADDEVTYLSEHYVVTAVYNDCRCLRIL